VAGIIGTTALGSGAEGLAGISCQNCVESTAERSCVETAQIIPDWGWGEISGALGGDEDRAWICLPLDEGPGVKAWFGEHDTQIQASAACAEGQSVPGT